MSQIKTFAAMVSSVALPGLKPKAIIAEDRRQHLKASKKDVARAAFYALTGGNLDDEKSKALHGPTIIQRGPGDEVAVEVAASTLEPSKKQKSSSPDFCPDHQVRRVDGRGISVAADRVAHVHPTGLATVMDALTMVVWRRC